VAIRSQDSAKTEAPRTRDTGPSYSLFGRVLLVVHVEVEDETTIPLISARPLDLEPVDEISLDTVLEAAGLEPATLQ
jgi:hypothetical protein